MLAACYAQAGTLTMLENPRWRVALDPATLEIEVTPAKGPAVPVSSGVGRHRVSDLQSTAATASWEWNDGAYRIAAELDDGDLNLTIHASTAGELMLLRQPATAIGRGLILPLAEGHYVARDSKIWRDFLLQQMASLNTTQDLSLPLWGLDHGDFSLHWMMTNPFNNRLDFNADQDGSGLGLKLSHEFTSLSPDTPMTLTLHLGGADLLAGAKRYRTWLMTAGRFESLKEKIGKSPSAVKLIGASHAYLWGAGLIAAKDVSSWPAFLAILRGKEALAINLRKHFDADSRKVLAEAGANLGKYQETALIRAFNAALDAIAREAWQTEALDVQRLANRYGELRLEATQVFARALTADPANWGGGVSIATMEQLRQAGLSRLWIGLGEGWEGGLWHPEAIAAGVKAGYLIGPYDSYETALPLGFNPDWATAHLGGKAYRECAIVLKDGKLKSGFNQSGHYTNPVCMQPLMEARVAALQEKTGFNSWFLDAYAAGMLFDDYRQTAPMTMARNAEANAASTRWISENRQMPAGSEDGNAVTAQGIFFAHGMQTPVIGWGDKEMYKDKNSPYYLGNYYPPEEPSNMFKAAPLKALYRSIYFDPAARLPLYQAVFHDSVITTHHWGFDNLKLNNVGRENELAQLLYNVPPLFHLSAGALAARLPQMQRQDAFFRPMHERLAYQALTGFRWLSADRQLQETRFADGTWQVANFSGKQQVFNGQRFPAYSVTANTPDGKTTVFASVVKHHGL
ncbi:glycosyl hydrolase family 101 [Collimonas sp. PA-H2]|nr:glycosyl hydrolase family 101 [Collimonas sp. PA-H2]